MNGNMCKDCIIATYVRTNWKKPLKFFAQMKNHPSCMIDIKNYLF
ncbi:unnamed protein product, partial [Tenebrio molitor]